MDERSRHRLYQRLQEVLGAEEAGTLMAHLPPGGVSQPATKDDLRRVKEELELKMDAMKQELRAEVHQSTRTLMLSLITVMAIMNGILFTALRLS